MNKVQLKSTLRNYGYSEVDHLSKDELNELLKAHLEGGSIFSNLSSKVKSIISRVKGFVTGARKHAPPSIRAFLEKHGSDKIQAIRVCRQPVERYVKLALNALSLGELSKKLGFYNYDDLFHLYLMITVIHEGQTLYVRLEKNHVVVVNVSKNSSTPGECMDVPLQTELDVVTLITRGEQYQGGDFWIWTSSNNCQVFVQSVLKGNGLDNQMLSDFIVQCVKCIMKAGVRSLSNALVNLAQRGDVLLHGSSLRDPQMSLIDPKSRSNKPIIPIYWMHRGGSIVPMKYQPSFQDKIYTEKIKRYLKK